MIFDRSIAAIVSLLLNPLGTLAVLLDDGQGFFELYTGAQEVVGGGGTPTARGRFYAFGEEEVPIFQ